MAEAKYVKLHEGTITFEVSGVHSTGEGHTLTIEYDGEQYATPIGKVHDGGTFEISFPYQGTHRSHGAKLLRREAGDEAYADYDR